MDERLRREACLDVILIITMKMNLLWLAFPIGLIFSYFYSQASHCDSNDQRHEIS